MSKPATESPYLTRAEAAAWWKVNVVSIDRWALKFGWRVHYTPEGSVRLLAEDVKRGGELRRGNRNRGHFRPKVVKESA